VDAAPKTTESVHTHRCVVCVTVGQPAMACQPVWHTASITASSVRVSAQQLYSANEPYDVAVECGGIMEMFRFHDATTTFGNLFC